MDINIRIYKNHDKDLFAVYSTVGGRQFGAYVKDVLSAYARGNKPQLKFPDMKTCQDNVAAKSARVHIALNDLKCQDEVNLIKDLNPACQQVFIKNLLKTYHMQELLPFYVQSSVNVKPMILETSQNSETIPNNLIAGLIAALNNSVAANTAQPNQTIESPTMQQEIITPDKADLDKEIRKQAESDMDDLADMFGL